MILTTTSGLFTPLRMAQTVLSPDDPVFRIPFSSTSMDHSKSSGLLVIKCSSLSHAYTWNETFDPTWQEKSCPGSITTYATGLWLGSIGLSHPVVTTGTIANRQQIIMMMKPFLMIYLLCQDSFSALDLFFCVI
jgi:hypothetical protein